MAIEITDGLVAHISQLSRLALSASEAGEIKGHFRKILQFVEILDRLDLSSVDPSFFPLETLNVFAKDEPQPSLSVEEALRNAPASREGYFLVPRIIAGAGGSAPGRARDEADPEESA
jgi:aspartyl-tRNA(Asn)/glutamyl-tRNA(Gln) amidotransferase subunit C